MRAPTLFVLSLRFLGTENAVHRDSARRHSATSAGAESPLGLASTMTIQPSDHVPVCRPNVECSQLAGHHDLTRSASDKLNVTWTGWWPWNEPRPNATREVAGLQTCELAGAAIKVGTCYDSFGNRCCWMAARDRGGEEGRKRGEGREAGREKGDRDERFSK
eukprot:1428740-Rhodomonas_salina.3